jgi:divalent metal cation (Fe/Co/Zn/Cd) transporter
MMKAQPVQIGSSNRASLVKRGRRLEYFTIVYNSLEGLIALGAGLMAGSIALVGFGFDSLIEVTSGAALLWRLHMDADESRRERVEAVTQRIVGACFLLLAAYVSYDSIKALIWLEHPRESIPGIVLAIASVIVMPLLVRPGRPSGYPTRPPTDPDVHNSCIRFVSSPARRHAH